MIVMSAATWEKKSLAIAILHQKKPVKCVIRTLKSLIAKNILNGPLTSRVICFNIPT